MKWSLYNFIIRNGSDYLLYNSLTNELMACVGGINSLLNEYKNNMDGLKQIFTGNMIMIKKVASQF